MSAPPLVFLDLETTGLHPTRQPWEAAVIRREPDGTEYSDHFFIEVDLSQADPQALGIGGFWSRHPMGRWMSEPQGDVEAPWPDGKGPFLSRFAAAARLARWTSQAHIVGLCPWFDTGTLDPLLRSNGLVPSWHYHLIDVGSMALGWLKGNPDTILGAGVTLPWSSDDLSRRCGVEPPEPQERHTAYGDAYWVLRWFDAITAA